MVNIFEDIPIEPLPPLGPTSDPNAVEVSEAALILTGLGHPTMAGRLPDVDLETELHLTEVYMQNPNRTDTDPAVSNTELES